MAEAAIGGNETVTEAAIAVPNYYDDQQRQAVKDAGRLARVDVLRTTNEPIGSMVRAVRTTNERLWQLT
ncbi:hypothetical protein F4823DRAFT_588597 [Ustulina deusta]|nr:hypothetical protein F4823DRAFT_588597 [Ustulina deusta]